MDYTRAIEEGIESARNHRKDGESPYHDCHPLFRYWWEAVNLKADWPDWSESRIRKHIMDKLGRR